MVESCPVTLFKKVSAYGKNEMKRERGGKGGKRKKKSRRDERIDKKTDCWYLELECCSPPEIVLG
jgi:hypothetical protein